MKEILSRQNAKFKTWLSLLDARGIKKSGCALLSGRKLVDEFLRQRPQEVMEILLPPKHAVTTSFDSYSLASPLFNELDTLGTKAPLLVVKAPVIDEWKQEPARGLELIVALSDPGNLGAVLRSAEAFGVRRVILTKEACSPFLPRALRAASGATFRIGLAKAEALADLQIPNGFCLHMEGDDLVKFVWPKNLYLVLGEEGRGVPESLELKRLSIRMTGQIESLNAMAAASIALFSHSSAHPRS